MTTTAKRARYSGPYPSVELTLPNGQTITIEHGHLVPTEAPDGTPIPATYRDQLLEQTDNWTEAKQATAPKTTPASADKEDDR